jgi:hypothetical protein
MINTVTTNIKQEIVAQKIYQILNPHGLQDIRIIVLNDKTTVSEH